VHSPVAGTATGEQVPQSENSRPVPQDDRIRREGQGGPRRGSGCCPRPAGCSTARASGRSESSGSSPRPLARGRRSTGTSLRKKTSWSPTCAASIPTCGPPCRPPSRPRRLRPTRCARSGPPSPTAWPRPNSAAARSSRPLPSTQTPTTAYAR